MRFNRTGQLRLFTGIKIGSDIIIKTDNLIGNSAGYRAGICFIQRDPAEFIFLIPAIIDQCFKIKITFKALLKKIQRFIIPEYQPYIFAFLT